MRMILAVSLNLLLGLAAWRKRAVSVSGGVAGFFVGTVIFAFAGPSSWILMGLFFVSSSLLSKLGRSKKAAIEDIHIHGSRRVWVQVLANGLPAALMALLFARKGDPSWLIGLATSFSVANADTWSSEGGVLSRGEPRLIIGLRRVPPGTSGAVSPWGFLFALFGGMLIGLGFAFLQLLSAAGLRFFSDLKLSWGFWDLVGWGFAIGIAGLLGSIIDSLLGASLQAQYRDGDLLTERPRVGGRDLTLVKGLAWMNNDMVNLLSIAITSLTMVLLYRV